MHLVRIITRAKGTCLPIREFETAHEEEGGTSVPQEALRVFFRDVKSSDRVNESASTRVRDEIKIGLLRGHFLRHVVHIRLYLKLHSSHSRVHL